MDLKSNALTTRPSWCTYRSRPQTLLHTRPRSRRSRTPPTLRPPPPPRPPRPSFPAPEGAESALWRARAAPFGCFRRGGRAGTGEGRLSPPRACAPHSAGTGPPPHPSAAPLAGAGARAEGENGEGNARGFGGAGPCLRGEGRAAGTQREPGSSRTTFGARARRPGRCQAPRRQGEAGGARSRPAAGPTRAATPRPWFLPFLDGAAGWDASWQVLLGKVGAM